ncbi:hypothetical protein BU16DRAFT_536411 [Lophium mytilinum]|uniref:Uncharacterized protein n=1 Tax=Lophium mytilinum TaxID=390894 RepID=A0A6A6R1F9_9PEZI|nr:hypothetical protein BU16DRAFT_536411 [Lophium mytilinum]
MPSRSSRAHLMAYEWPFTQQDTEGWHESDAGEAISGMISPTVVPDAKASDLLATAAGSCKSPPRPRPGRRGVTDARRDSGVVLAASVSSHESSRCAYGRIVLFVAIRVARCGSCPQTGSNAWCRPPAIGEQRELQCGPASLKLPGQAAVGETRPRGEIGSGWARAQQVKIHQQQRSLAMFRQASSWSACPRAIERRGFKVARADETTRPPGNGAPKLRVVLSSRSSTLEPKRRAKRGRDERCAASVSTRSSMAGSEFSRPGPARQDTQANHRSDGRPRAGPVHWTSARSRTTLPLPAPVLPALWALNTGGNGARGPCGREDGKRRGLMASRFAALAAPAGSGLSGHLSAQQGTGAVARS